MNYKMLDDESKLMMPIHNNGGRNIQIFINEFLINSAFYSFHSIGAFQKTKTVPKQIIMQIIDDFDYYFGSESDTVDVNIKSIDPAPILKIGNSA